MAPAEPAAAFPFDDVPDEPVVESLPAPLPVEVGASFPERAFAARVPPPEPERPRPSVRRGVFFDVENTSRAEHVDRVLTHLALDRIGVATELVAVGNWRVIGHDTARLLARQGAHLVHSAPSTGVRDWSDLRIAVAAGVWLAAARAGDTIEIVSDDQAFDAVGDVAASLGVHFLRLSYRGLAGVMAERAERPVAQEAEREGRSRRRRRGGRRGRRGEGQHPSDAPIRHHVAAPSPAPITNGVEEPHTAPNEQVIEVVRGLVGGVPGRGVSIDAVSNALKARGFRRPPGSLRLITRLRRIKELVVTRNGSISLAHAVPAEESAPAVANPYDRVGEAAASPYETLPDLGEESPWGEPGFGETAPAAGEGETGPAAGEGEAALAPEGSQPSGRPRRRRRRGGRRRRGRGGGSPAVVAAP